jgi:uncharacterized radical SAM protein YgiQ
MNLLRWDQCDIIIVTGDAFVDHPAFGAALIGRLLESHGFRVGIIAQPPWQSADAFRALGKPSIMFGVTSGNMDSMINHYTAEKLPRSDDAYTPGNEAGKRPDRAVITYCMRCKEAFPGIPIVIGGIEASLRRVAHYDYWSEKIRRSILPDSKADLLVYGNGERAVTEIAHRLAAGEKCAAMTDIRGTVFCARSGHGPADAIRIPSFEKVCENTDAFLEAEKIIHTNLRPESALPIVQGHGNRDVCIMAPQLPLDAKELDRLYELPFSRRPHPSYGTKRIPARDMSRWSVTVVRGCYGGCTFCSLACHQGPVIQSRTPESVVREIRTIMSGAQGFTGVISDLGGPSANMYGTGGRNRQKCGVCKRQSCLYPSICPNLNTNQKNAAELYETVRRIDGIKKVLIGSGIRFDLALEDEGYIRALVGNHVGGHLKIAPEHISPGPLACMGKPDLETYERFSGLFKSYSRSAGKKQYLVPYFIAGHPGTTNEDMLELSLWLKNNKIRVDQVQSFLPSPMTRATAMYYAGVDPLDPARRKVFVPRGAGIRRVQKAFIRYHDPENWPVIRKNLELMGRGELIGSGTGALVPCAVKYKR